MGVSKVIYDGKTLVDLTEDSVSPSTLARGTTAHNAAGEPIEGEMPVESVLYVEQTLTDGQKEQARKNIGAVKFAYNNTGGSGAAACKAYWESMPAGKVEISYNQAGYECTIIFSKNSNGRYGNIIRFGYGSTYIQFLRYTVGWIDADWANMDANNAQTAVKLATAIAINGVTFDGSKSISLTPKNIGAVGNTGDETIGGVKTFTNPHKTLFANAAIAHDVASFTGSTTSNNAGALLVTLPKGDHKLFLTIDVSSSTVSSVYNISVDTSDLTSAIFSGTFSGNSIAVRTCKDANGNPCLMLGMAGTWWRYYLRAAVSKLIVAHTDTGVDLSQITLNMITDESQYTELRWLTCNTTMPIYPDNFQTNVPVSKGGTGAGTAEAARTNLSVPSVEEMNAAIANAMQNIPPAHSYGTEDLEAGVTALETGKLYFVYE